MQLSGAASFPVQREEPRNLQLNGLKRNPGGGVNGSPIIYFGTGSVFSSTTRRSVAWSRVAVARGTLGRVWSGPGDLVSHLDSWGTAVVGAGSSVLVNNLPAGLRFFAASPARSPLLSPSSRFRWPSGAGDVGSLAEERDRRQVGHERQSLAYCKSVSAHDT